MGGWFYRCTTSFRRAIAGLSARSSICLPGYLPQAIFQSQNLSETTASQALPEKVSG